MESVYFPYTYVSDKLMAALASCFTKASVYQPLAGKLPGNMAHWAERDRLGIRTPSRPDDDILNRLIEEYKQWADLHQAGGLAAFKARGESVPFFNESSVSQIRKEIKTGKQKQVSTEKPDPFKNARIFLQIAQEYDIQQNDIRQKLASFEEMRQGLFRELKGGDEDIDLLAEPNERPVDHMAEERLVAWARLYIDDPVESGLFITTSRDVVNSMIDKIDGIETVWGPESVPIYAEGSESVYREFAEFVENLRTDSAGPEFPFNRGNNPDPVGQATLTFHIARRVSPVDVFSQFIGNSEKNTGDSTGTLIGLVELA